jgi:hypothetical protein
MKTNKEVLSKILKRSKSNPHSLTLISRSMLQLDRREKVAEAVDEGEEAAE